MNGKKDYYMVHLDVCGAAYDQKALVAVPDDTNTLVSLQTFITPEYAMIPNSDEHMKHKLVMKAMTSKRDNIFHGRKGRNALEPKSNRYFRCYHKDDTSSIEVTPLATYLERNQFNDDVAARISEIVMSIKQKVILQLPVGSVVTVCNIKSKSELNGCTGVVCKSTGKDKVASDRIPLQVKGHKKPLSLKATSISLPAVKKRQYQTLEEKLSEHNKTLEEDEEYQEVKNMKPLSRSQKSQISAALSDPDVVKVLTIIQTGQMVFTSYGDATFKRGVGKCLKPPLLNNLFPKSLTESIRNGYELSNHPKADEAIKLINLLKAAKQRMLAEDDPNMDDVIKVQMSVAKRIKSDDGLNFVFDKLEELGLYTNIAKLYPP